MEVREKNMRREQENIYIWEKGSRVLKRKGQSERSREKNLCRGFGNFNKIAV